MDLRTLRCFLTVAEEGSITRAALRLHMSQPPLSVRLQALERELDVALLVRHGRGVELTAAGRVLAERARRLLSDADSTAEAVRSVGPGHARASLGDRGRDGRAVVAGRPAGVDARERAGRRGDGRGRRWAARCSTPSATPTPTPG